jgi:hypothetical protein
LASIISTNPWSCENNNKNNNSQHRLSWVQTPAEHAALEEVQQLKAELANPCSDATSMAALASEHKPTGLCRSLD